MSKYINQNNISEQTKAVFNDFIANIKDEEVAALYVPNKIMRHYMRRYSIIATDYWCKSGLIDVDSGDKWAPKDTALATILTVLRKRGFDTKAMKQVVDGLNMTIKDELTFLEFIILFCKDASHINERALLLVIDGENRLTLCMAHDMPQIISTPQEPTYSQTVLNLGAIMAQCCFMHKIDNAEPWSLMELPALVRERFYGLYTQRLDIDVRSKRLHTYTAVAPDSTDTPEYGERATKYQDNRPVCSILKTTEVLDV